MHRTFPGGANAAESIDEHPELDILDTLNLSGNSTQIRLKDLLLDTSEDAEYSLKELTSVVQKRLLEGHGEALFDLGQEDNGDSMAFSSEQWNIALDKMRHAASFLKADCRVLLTRNVGGPEEAETMNPNETAAIGKLLIRQAPETTEDVIETRVAVVGNGTYFSSPHDHKANRFGSRCWQKHYARSARKGGFGRRTWKGKDKSIPTQA